MCVPIHEKPQPMSEASSNQKAYHRRSVFLCRPESFSTQSSLLPLCQLAHTKSVNKTRLSREK